MADLSKITTPDGAQFNLKDAYARELIDQLSGYTQYLGVTTTEITDGSTTNPIMINGASVTANRGDIANYGSKEFIFNGTAWQEFGDLSGLGAMAHADTASGYVTPAGSVSAPAITTKTPGATATVKNPTKETVAKNVVAAAPGATAPANSFIYYNVENETLKLYQLGYETGDSITTQDVTVKTGDAEYEAGAQTFTGTQVGITVNPD